MSKLVNVSILFPSNVIIFLNNNTLIIKGPFGVITKKIFDGTKTDLFFNINKINIKYYNTISNRLTFYIDKKNYSVHKIWYHNLLSLLKKYIDIVSTGFLSVLQVWGVGYKILKKDDSIYIFLGYSHSIKVKMENQIYFKPFEGTYLFITNHLKDNLLATTSQLKKLRKKDVYKGKGIRFMNETIKLKVGKKE